MSAPLDTDSATSGQKNFSFFQFSVPKILRMLIAIVTYVIDKKTRISREAWNSFDKLTFGREIRRPQFETYFSRFLISESKVKHETRRWDRIYIYKHTLLFMCPSVTSSLHRNLSKFSVIPFKICTVWRLWCIRIIYFDIQYSVLELNLKTIFSIASFLSY